MLPENDTQTETFTVVRKALVNTGKVAIGKVAFSGRENIIAVMPAPNDDRGMMAYTLRFSNELRNQNDYFRDIKPAAVKADYLELAETLIRKMSAKLDMSQFEDGYEIAVKALVDAKINHLPVPVDEAPTKQSTNVINLMDALRKSLGSDTRPMKKPPKSEKVPPAKKIALVKSPSKRKTA